MNAEIPTHRLDSTHLRTARHDPATNTLTIQFQSGESYHYDGVDAAKFQAFMGADSQGQYFHRNIKGRHPHRKA